MRTTYGLVMAPVLALLVAACGQESPVAEPQATSPEATTAATPEVKDGGVIEARVTYAGEPVVETIKINKDVEQCGSEARMAKVAVGDNGALAFAVVSVAGLDGPPTARTPQIDQRGCQFVPRVVGMQAGEIEFLNSDGILHNVRTYSEANPAINKAQPGFRKVMKETFQQPEVIKVTCDVHSWMVGWVAVLPHPYFGVTDAQGVTRIEGVPAGSHTIEVWHEELGRQTMDVTVQAGETATVAVEFPKG